MIQELTIQKVYTPTATIYIIPESSHLRECRREDNNTLLFFPPAEVEWKKSSRFLNPPLMPIVEDMLPSALLTSAKVNIVGNSPLSVPSVKLNTSTEEEN